MLHFAFGKQYWINLHMVRR